MFQSAPMIRLAALILAGALLATGPGMAVSQTRGGGPVQIEADDIDSNPETRSAVLTGNAAVIQNGSALRSNVLRVTYLGGNGGPTGDIDRVVADQEVFYVTPTQRVRGDRGVFDARNGRITISGRVTVTQGRNVLQGQELVINTTSGAWNMRGVNGRVRAVFFPESGNNR